MEIIVNQETNQMKKRNEKNYIIDKRKTENEKKDEIDKKK